MLSRGGSQVPSRLLRAGACWCLLFAWQTCWCSESFWLTVSSWVSWAFQGALLVHCPLPGPGAGACTHWEQHCRSMVLWVSGSVCWQTSMLDFNISPGSEVHCCSLILLADSCMGAGCRQRSDTCSGLWAPAACACCLCGLSSGRYWSSISSWGGRLCADLLSVGDSRLSDVIL